MYKTNIIAEFAEKGRGVRGESVAIYVTVCLKSVSQSYLAIVNPAAGGGRGRKTLSSALERLRAGGVAIDVAETQGAGDATRIARAAYGRGRRKFIAVGGDGTSYEVVNGLFRASVRAWDSCPWGREILFSAISATVELSTRLSH